MCWGAFSSVPCAFAQCVVFLLFLCPALRKKCPVRWAAGDAKVLVWELHVPNPSPMTHACVGVSGWSLFLFSTPFFHAFPSTRHAHQVQVFSPEYCIFISLPLSAFFLLALQPPRGEKEVFPSALASVLQGKWGWCRVQENPVCWLMHIDGRSESAVQSIIHLQKHTQKLYAIFSRRCHFCLASSHSSRS